MKRPAIIFILFLTCISVLKAKKNDDGLLWRVTGNGLKKATYLFGTVHLYCTPENIQRTVIQNAMDSSAMVAMEINLNDFNAIISYIKSSSILRSSGKSIKKMLTKKEYDLVDSACMALLGASLESMDSFSMLYVLNRLNTSEPVVGCSAAFPVDMTIAAMAREKNKPSYGLESFGFQDSLLSAIPDAMQQKWLLEFCRDIPHAVSEFRSMMANYDAQRSLHLYDILIKTSPEMNYFNDVLLKQRNLKWVKFLKENMKSEPYFVAIGAGHLGGSEGLVNLLRQAGYAVTPVLIK